MIFASDRFFAVHRYEQPHGLLLFRSLKGRHGASTRIDVLFQDVRALEIRFWTSGLQIDELDVAQVVRAASNPIALMEPGNRVFGLSGDGWSGFILGGVVSTSESEDDDNAPSRLLGTGLS